MGSKLGGGGGGERGDHVLCSPKVNKSVTSVGKTELFIFGYLLNFLFVDT